MSLVFRLRRLIGPSGCRDENGKNSWRGVATGAWKHNALPLSCKARWELGQLWSISWSHYVVVLLVLTVYRTKINKSKWNLKKISTEICWRGSKCPHKHVDTEVNKLKSVLKSYYNKAVTINKNIKWYYFKITNAGLLEMPFLSDNEVCLYTRLFHSWKKKENVFTFLNHLNVFFLIFKVNLFV